MTQRIFNADDAIRELVSSFGVSESDAISHLEFADVNGYYLDEDGEYEIYPRSYGYIIK